MSSWVAALASLQWPESEVHVFALDLAQPADVVFGERRDARKHL